MNRIYRLVWNRNQQAWIPVSEVSGGLARGGNKSTRSKLLVASLSLCSAIAQANPSGGVVTAGSGSIAQTGTTTTIQQNSQNLSLNWNSFNIAANQIVNFVQPSAAAIAVNRIFDTSATQILGQLNANGQVYLINPNGIVFGQGSQVNVGGLVASTLDVNDASLNSASKTFSGTGTGSIINKGNLVAANGGYIALIANQVSNQGIISAQLGSVALAGGSDITLTFADNSLVQVQVNQSTLNNLAENKQLVVADGGQVFMSAGAKNSLLASVVNNTGIIEAQTVSSHAGVITLLGGMEAGTVNVAGTLDASAPNGGNGGAIETSAATVKVADNTIVTTKAASGNTGTWLIDPTNFTIASGSGALTGSSIGATTLQNALTNTDMSITTSANGSDLGDINVNAAFAWGSHLLTLNALNNININATMTATGTASLALNYGLGAPASGNTSQILTGAGASVILPASTTNFTTTQGANGVQKTYTVLTTLGAINSTTQTDLQGINGDLALNYALGSNIDATATSTWNSGAGFTPLGNFNGSFNGLGHVISNLTINLPSTNYVGLFSTFGSFGNVSSTAGITNVGLVGDNVIGYDYVGGLVGFNFGTISNSYATGLVTGYTRVGGLLGQNNSAISNSYATSVVTGNTEVGGLIGLNYGALTRYSFFFGAISNSYATGAVTGVSYLGGLVGKNYSGTISNSYATGAVTGTSYLGGLVGYSLASSVVNNSFWNINTTGIDNSQGGTGMSTANMTNLANFTGFTIANGSVNPLWDFSTTWGMSSAINGGHPYLLSNLPPSPSLTTTIYLDLMSGSSVYGSAPTFSLYSGTGPTAGFYVYDTSATYGSDGSSVIDPATLRLGGTINWSSVLTNTTNVTSSPYSISYSSGLTLGNSTYTLVAGNAASWSITKAPLGISNSTAIYVGSTTIGSNNGTYTLTGLVASDSGATVSSATINDANVSGANKFSGVTLSDGHESNYSLNASANTTLGTDTSNIVHLAQVDLIITGATTLNSVYTGNAQTNTWLTPVGLLGSDTVTGMNGLATRTTVGSSTDSLSAATGTGLANYNISYSNGSLHVTPASLTITANNQTRLYGGVNPTYTETISGFMNGENSSVVSGVPTATSTATSATDVGSVVITASNSGLSAANYNFNTLVDGILTIDSLPAIIVAPITTTEATQANVSSQLVSTMTVPPALTPPITSNTPPLKVTYSPSSDPTQGGSVTFGLNIIDTGIKLPSTGNNND